MMTTDFRVFIGFVICSCCLVLDVSSVSFDREIRPILTAHCYSCHGPDSASREADLRLDQESSARKVLKEILDRINSKDVDDIMPPPESGKKLSQDQKDLLTQWVQSGGNWEVHWSTKPLIRPSIPTQGYENRNPIDGFIRSKLNEVGLEPSSEADPAVYIRRVTYDLIGLPPTPDEIKAFKKAHAVDADKAIERLVDRLLASEHYGERWGRHWLDVVKYADTCGYDKDKLRPNAWPYRDYVIRSFNEDKPYAQFVQEQIAGDVLFPDSEDGILGLGFIAAGPWDFIGHVEVSESKIDGRIARHIDRDEMVANTINTFTSTTVQCARCHDHKFDPITQDHYYGLQSVFAAVDRADRVFSTDPKVEKRKSELMTLIQSLENEKKSIEEDIAGEGGESLKLLDQKIAKLKTNDFQIQKRAEFGFHSQIAKKQSEHKWVRIDLGEEMEISKIILHPAHDDYNNIGGGFGFPLRFQVLGHSSESLDKSMVLLDQSGADFPNPNISPVEIPSVVSARYITLSVSKLAERSQDYILAMAEISVLNSDGINISKGKKVIAQDSIEAPVRWARVNLTDGYYPKTSAPEKLKELQTAQSNRDVLLNRIRTPERLARLNELSKRSKSKQEELNKLPKGKLVYAAATHFSPQGNFKPTQGTPRPIKVLHRGNILDPKHEAQPGYFPVLNQELEPMQLNKDHTESDRRAQLASWITRKDHPLTWRSIVNRVWLWHFGEGIVSTPNDFGRMGQPPSHPALLDWLACEFRDSNGSMKHLHKLIVTSATYRQVSRPNERGTSVDSNNRFLWRMNRRRLHAEELRDSILSVSGALDKRVGGPGFYLFALEKTAHSPHYEYHKYDPTDVTTHRRSIYRFIVRSQPNPFMTTLDCADSSKSTPKRDETLTALQALSLMNNKFSIHMAEKFAQRLKSQAKILPNQVDWGFNLVTGRLATPDEHSALLGYANEHGLANFCRVLFNLSEFIYLD